MVRYSSNNTNDPAIEEIVRNVLEDGLEGNQIDQLAECIDTTPQGSLPSNIIPNSHFEDAKQVISQDSKLAPSLL